MPRNTCGEPAAPPSPLQRRKVRNKTLTKTTARRNRTCLNYSAATLGPTFWVLLSCYSATLLHLQSCTGKRLTVFLHIPPLDTEANMLVGVMVTQEVVRALVKAMQKPCTYREPADRSTAKEPYPALSTRKRTQNVQLSRLGLTSSILYRTPDRQPQRSEP